jgi:hypothetical protein
MRSPAGSACLRPRVRGRPQHAEDVERRLVAVRGVHRAHANPTTGSVTVHYHPSALESAEFFTEVAAALGLVATGLEPSQVESMFRLLGVSPEDIRAAWGDGLWPRWSPCRSRASSWVSSPAVDSARTGNQRHPVRQPRSRRGLPGRTNRRSPSFTRPTSPFARGR